MSRPLRIEYRGAYYHVMNRGTARQKIFLNDHDRQGFLDLLGETVLGLEKYSSVSSACLSMKARVEREKKLAKQGERIKRLLLNSQQQT